MPFNPDDSLCNCSVCERMTAEQRAAQIEQDRESFHTLKRGAPPPGKPRSKPSKKEKLMHKSIALVDLSYLVARHYHARAADTSTPKEAIAIAVTDAVLSDLAGTKESVEHTILCMDAPPYWRKKLYPEYKSKREVDEFLNGIKRNLYERLDRDGWNMARVDSFEADDVIATLAKVYSEKCEDIRIVGADKDASQCVTDRVRMFVPKIANRSAMTLGPAEIAAKFEGTPPVHMALFQALVGDATDTVPGIDKAGPKTAAKMIALSGGDLAKLASLGADWVQNPKCPTVWKNLVANWEPLRLWIKLVTLRTDVPIDHEALLKKREPLRLSSEGIDTFDADPIEEEEPNWDEVEAVVTAEQAKAEANALGSCDHHQDCAKADQLHREWCKSRNVEYSTVNRHPQTGNRTWLHGAPEPKPPLIGKDPRADEVLKSESAARARAIQQAAAEWAKQAATGDYVGAMKEAAVVPKVEPASSVPNAGDPSSQTDKSPSAGAAPARPRKQSATAKLREDTRIAEAEFTQAALSKPPEASTAIVRASVPWELQLQPNSAAEALAISRSLHESPHLSVYGKPESILNVILMGRELGIGMQAALTGFFIVEGKPFASAKLIRGLCLRRSNICKYLICTHSDENSATWETVRIGVNGDKPMSFTYTRAEAELAGMFTGKNQHTWKTKPKPMISKTCCSKGCWQWYADLLMGLPQDEEDDYAP